MRLKTILIAALCATVAAAAGIAGSSAATKSHKTRKSTNSSSLPGRPFGRMMMGGPVHVDAVVLNKAGTAWITVTEDNGTVSSVSGDQLVITEGTTAVPYKTVTLTIPSDATIIRNGQKAALSDFQSGDHVHVSQSSDGTIVFGGNQVPSGPMGHHWGHGDRGGAGGPWGPPPGAGYGSDNGSSSSSSSSTTTS